MHQHTASLLSDAEQLGRSGGAPRRPTGASPATALPASAAPFASSLAPELRDLIRRLPKAELHIHIEGTLEPELMLAMAARNNVTLPYPNIEAARRARRDFTSLQDFLDAFNLGQSVLLTRRDFHDLTAAYLTTAAANNVSHAEIFVDLQHHLARGVPVGEVLAGLQSAIDEHKAAGGSPVDASLILCLVRELGEAAAAKTLATALPYIRQFKALGLASTEVPYPPELYARVYKTAGLLGLHKVAHAGEEGGPDYVWQALRELHVERVDHGIHALDDPALVAYMAEHKVPITLCPLSNLKLKVFDGQLDHKLRELLASGIAVTINSDDPAYFGPAYINANFEYIAEVGDLGPDDLAKLARASFAASFIPGAQKLAAFGRVRAALEAWKAEQQQQQQQRVEQERAAPT